MQHSILSLNKKGQKVNKPTAKILAQRKVVVTIVTTPLNAIRFSTPIDRAGLPKGCENTDSLPSPNPVKNFVTVASMLQQQLEQIIMFEELKPHPSCIISDRNLAWTADTAFKFGIPRILFDSTNCFNLVCSHNLHKSNVFETVLSNSELFTVPELPDQIGFTRAQLPPRSFNRDSNRQDHMSSIQEKIREAEGGAYGVLVNSCEELEPAYVQEYRKTIEEKIWCIGPVSLCNKDTLDMAERGKKGSIDETQCLKWLDSWPPRTVVYACFGSLNRLTPPQLVELGLGLEVSNKPFIWVIRGEYRREETEKWGKKEERRERVGKVGEIGKRAIEEGGSSYLNMALLVEDIMQLTKKQTKFNT
ncbi:hypothetical protein I3842_09G003600 [Carya illinoinensis]|uniref:Uncharacterized protein n=1 Tax=Carya illinoinensis TaxID=32201 RepID=A0A922J3T2_CARIL|nr:hypothetical protein I3842_09G003600 [Carya illinoinensis]